VIRDVLSLDLFPTHVKIFDFEDDPDLNGALLTLARRDQSANSSLSGKSLLLRTEPWVGRLRAKLERALRAYLGDVRSDRRDFAIEAYAFLNYHNGLAFTPVRTTPLDDPVDRSGTARLSWLNPVESAPNREPSKFYPTRLINRTKPSPMWGS
jgi:hypothetical protein